MQQCNAKAYALLRFITPIMSQHVSTGWLNARSMLRPICCRERLRSFGRGLALDVFVHLVQQNLQVEGWPIRARVSSSVVAFIPFTDRISEKQDTLRLNFVMSASLLKVDKKAIHRNQKLILVPFDQIRRCFLNSLLHTLQNSVRYTFTVQTHL